MTDWKTYRKTQTVDALLIEDEADLPEETPAYPERNPVSGHTTGRVNVPTSHGLVQTETPFYLCRGPDGEVYPHSADTFDDRYELVDQEDDAS